MIARVGACGRPDVWTSAAGPSCRAPCPSRRRSPQARLPFGPGLDRALREFALWAAAALLGVLAAARPAAAAPEACVGAASIPFEFDDARLWVRTRVGAAAQADWFVLDTGAASHAIDRAVALRLGLQAEDAGRWGGAGAGESAVGSVADVELHAGDTTLHATRANVLPLEQLLADTSGRHVGGILGAPLFAQHVVEIDFERRSVCLRDAATYRAAGAGVRIALTLADGLPLASGTLTLPDGRCLALRLLLDLGAKSTLLVAEPFIERHDLRRVFPDAQVARLGAGLGGPTHYAFARTARIALEAAGLDRAVVGLSVAGTLRASWYDGLLGADFFSRFRVVFDLPHRQVVLLPREAALAPAEFDMSGLFVRAVGADLRRFVVDEVRAGSAAARAGLRNGDEIVAVDERAVSSLSLGDLRDALKAGDGRLVHISYRRAGVQERAVLRLTRL